MTITAPSTVTVEPGAAGVSGFARPIRMVDGDRPVLVGFMPPLLSLPCEGGTRCVQVSYPSYLHICQRREINTPEMLDLVLSRLRSVVYRPTYSGNLSGDVNKLDLFAWVPEDPAGVLVCVKCLKGESWVSTAFPMGRKSLRKHLNTGKLRPVG
jgi:hypothetical protein